MIDVDDLDELQVVTRREYRRGYTAQVNGDLARLRYRKLMRTPDGMFVVCRPAIGEERLKSGLQEWRRALGIFFIVAWPVTALCIFGLVGLIALGIRHL